MIKAKHLLALSLAAVIAVPAFATDNTIEFTGSITTPTCQVKVAQELEMGTVSTQSFTQTIAEKKVSQSKEFTLTVVDENDAVCQSVSYASSNASENSSEQPNIRITSENGFTEDGYLKNAANGTEENPTLALLITDANDNKIDLNSPKLVSTDNQTGAIHLKAHYVALADKVAVQQFVGSLSFTVDYK